MRHSLVQQSVVIVCQGFAVPSTYYLKSAAVFPVGRKGIILQTSEEIELENKEIDLLLKSIVSCIQHCSGR